MLAAKKDLVQPNKSLDTILRVAKTAKQDEDVAKEKVRFQVS